MGDEGAGAAMADMGDDGRPARRGRNCATREVGAAMADLRGDGERGDGKGPGRGRGARGSAGAGVGAPAAIGGIGRDG